MDKPPSTNGKPAQERDALGRYHDLRTHGVVVLYKVGGDLVARIPRHYVRQLDLVRGQLVAWSDVGDGRLLLRKATVTVHGSGDVRPD
jgi:hypothetical protein